MLRFLKALFAKNIEKVVVEQRQLQDWFLQKTKPIKELLEEELRSAAQELRQKINQIKESLDALEAAELRNPDIPLRAKQIMEGNREAYIKRLNVFLQNIRPPAAISDIGPCLTQWNAEVESLAKATAKEYRVLQEFLAHESREVANNIKDVERIMEKIRGISKDEKLLMVEEVEKMIAELGQKRSRLELLEKSLQKKKGELKDLDEVKKDLEQKIKNILKEPAYRAFQLLKEDRSAAAAKANAKSAEIVLLFSMIEKALRKYFRISYEDERLLAPYLESPLKALENDTELQITSVLQKVKAAVQQQKITLEEKKSERTIKAIDAMDKERLNTLRKECLEQREKLSLIDEKMMQDTAEAKIEGYKRHLSYVEDFQKRLHAEMKNIEEDIAAVSLEGLKERAQEKILALLNINAIIS